MPLDKNSNSNFKSVETTPLSNIIKYYKNSYPKPNFLVLNNLQKLICR